MFYQHMYEALPLLQLIYEAATALFNKEQIFIFFILLLILLYFGFIICSLSLKMYVCAGKFLRHTPEHLVKQLQY